MILETVLGGLTGLIGNALTSFFNYKTQKLKNEHEIEMVKAETQAMVTEAKANIAVTRATVEGDIELADAEAYIQAQKLGNQKLFGNKWVDKLLEVQGKARWFTIPLASLVAFLFGMVDFLRGLMRPVLTAWLTGVSTWITIKAWDIMQMEGISFTADQATKIFEDTTSIVIYLTVSCVTWWFGDRRMAKTIMEQKGADRTKIDDNIII